MITFPLSILMFVLLLLICFWHSQHAQTTPIPMYDLTYISCASIMHMVYWYFYTINSDYHFMHSAKHCLCVCAVFIYIYLYIQTRRTRPNAEKLISPTGLSKARCIGKTIKTTSTRKSTFLYPQLTIAICGIETGVLNNACFSKV